MGKSNICVHREQSPTRFTELTVEQVTSSVRLNRLRYICAFASGAVKSWRECIETMLQAGMLY